MREFLIAASTIVLCAAGAAPVLEFRGGRESTPSFQVDGIHGFEDSRGRLSARYFVGADSSDRVIVTVIDGDRIGIESPGEWTGMGVVIDTTYWGVFAYRNDAGDPRNHGARGTHLGTIERSGRIRIRGTFTNREWPDFQVTWSPLKPTSAGTVDWERLLELPTDELFEHPIWPRDRGREPSPRPGDLIWPR